MAKNNFPSSLLKHSVKTSLLLRIRIGIGQITMGHTKTHGIITNLWGIPFLLVSRKKLSPEETSLVCIGITEMHTQCLDLSL